jgi:hypothetical protein
MWTFYDGVTRRMCISRGGGGVESGGGGVARQQREGTSDADSIHAKASGTICLPVSPVVRHTFLQQCLQIPLFFISVNIS